MKSRTFSTNISALTAVEYIRNVIIRIFYRKCNYRERTALKVGM